MKTQQKRLRNELANLGLNSEEQLVAVFVTQGLSNKEISEFFFIPEKKVKEYLESIYSKTNLTSRAQIIVWSLPFLEF